jgi:hypothetical protein
MWVVSVTPRPRFTTWESIPGNHWIRGWERLKTGLDTEARGKNPLPGIEPRSSSLYSDTIPTVLPQLMPSNHTSCKCHCTKKTQITLIRIACFNRSFITHFQDLNLIAENVHCGPHFYDFTTVHETLRNSRQAVGSIKAVGITLKTCIFPENISNKGSHRMYRNIRTLFELPKWRRYDGCVM